MEVSGKGLFERFHPSVGVQCVNCCGICPYNPEVFSSENFEVSKVTELDETVEEDPEEGSDVVPVDVTCMEVFAIEPSITIDIDEEQIENNFDEISGITLGSSSADVSTVAYDPHIN